MWAVTSFWLQKVVSRSQIYLTRAKLRLISDQARDLVENCFDGRPLCVPFKTARLHPGSWITRLSQGSFIHLMIDVEKARVIEWVRVIWWYFARIKCGNIVPGWLWIVLSVPRTWLIVWFPEVVDRQNLQVCRAARVNIRILCTCMKTLRECLVFCLRQPILGSRKVNSSFSRASRREPHNLRDRKVGSEKQILPIIFYCLRTAINF